MLALLKQQCHACQQLLYVKSVSGAGIADSIPQTIDILTDAISTHTHTVAADTSFTQISFWSIQ